MIYYIYNGEMYFLIYFDEYIKAKRIKSFINKKFFN